MKKLIFIPFFLVLSACSTSTIHAPCSHFGAYCKQVYINPDH